MAANYNQALAEIDKKLPDVAILDVKLDKGDNDGIELLSHIKSKNKDTPVIIISGHANNEMAVKTLQHGAFEFIEKKHDRETFFDKALFATRQLAKRQTTWIRSWDKFKEIDLMEPEMLENDVKKLITAL